MKCEVVLLNPDYLDTLLKGTSLEFSNIRRAYFSEGSASLCLLADGVPVFAGGIVNLHWNRGEAWMLPTQFFRSNVKTCLKALKHHLPGLAKNCGFVRVQATCVKGVSDRIFQSLGFIYEGTLAKFGPNGETCTMYARIIEP